MIRPVMLDTSFLIAYSDPSRANHVVAREYFRAAIKSGIPLLVSTLVVAEFERRQSLSDLGLANFRIMPFNFDDALLAAELAEKLDRSKAGAVGERVCLAADVKIIAQAQRANSQVVLTEDASTMAKQIDSLRTAGIVDLYPVLPADGFDLSRLLTPATPGLSFPVAPPILVRDTDESA